MSNSHNIELNDGTQAVLELIQDPRDGSLDVVLKTSNDPRLIYLVGFQFDQETGELSAIRYANVSGGLEAHDIEGTIVTDEVDGSIEIKPERPGLFSFLSALLSDE